MTVGPAGFAQAHSAAGALKVLTVDETGTYVDPSGGGGGGGGGDASAAKQDEQTTLLGNIDSHVDQLEGYLDGVETAIASTNTKLNGGLPAALGAQGALKIEGVASGTVVPVSGTVTANAGTGTLAVSAASLPLPSGASTAAKQPALGTAGSSATDVLSVQGIASGTALPVSAASLPLPSGAATSAKQPALGTAGSASTDVITVQGIASGTAQPVTAGGYTVQSVAQFTRPADTTAYAAKDAMADSTSAPTILTFASCARVSGGSGYVTKARLVTDQAANVSAYRLHLYDATLSAVNDNAAQTSLYANRASKIGYIDIPALATDGSDTAEGLSTQAPLPFVAAGTSLFGMLETITGFTPASGQKFYVQLGIEQN